MEEYVIAVLDFLFAKPPLIILDYISTLNGTWQTVWFNVWGIVSIYSGWKVLSWIQKNFIVFTTDMIGFMILKLLFALALGMFIAPLYIVLTVIVGVVRIGISLFDIKKSGPTISS